MPKTSESNRPKRHTSHGRRGANGAASGDAGEQLPTTATATVEAHEQDGVRREFGPATTGGLQGRIEKIGKTGIAGWVWNPRAPDQQIRLELVEGETCLKSAVAGDDRPDLVPLGCGDGRHGFTIELEQGVLTDGPCTLVLRCADTAEPVPGSPIVLKEPYVGEIANGPHPAVAFVTREQTFRGYIDRVTETTILGWIMRPDRPMDRCIVALKEGKRIIARTVASQLRLDLVSAGVADGCYGFVLEPPPSLSDGEEHLLEVIEEETGFAVTSQPIQWRRDTASYHVGFADLPRTKLERVGGGHNRKRKETSEPGSQGLSRPDTIQDRHYFHFEGPMKGDYSLAIVNRHFASALIQVGQEVVLTPPEQDLLEDAAFLQKPELLPRLFGRQPMGLREIRSSNDWPIRDPVSPGVNVIHCFAWEESIIPLQLAARLSAYDLVTTTASFVTKALRNSGVTSRLATIGNGVDHIPRPGIGRQLRTLDASEPFVFLHASSCFARKGIDVLLDAYFSEFSSSDNVRLVIKTFENPHNRALLSQISSHRSSHFSPPALEVRIESLEGDAYYRLFADADCLVAPSFGEGFLFPAAEALLNNVPVIATNWGGHLDFCSDGAAWLIDARLEKSASHVAGPGSLWAIPSTEHLRRLMREMTQISVSERASRVIRGQQTLERNYRWSDVARRYLEALQPTLMEDGYRSNSEPRSEPPAGRTKARRSMPLAASCGAANIRLDPVARRPYPPGRHVVISTFGQRCGIATFAAELLEAAASSADIVGVVSELVDDVSQVDDTLDTPFPVQRVWRRHLSTVPETISTALKLRPDHVLIEHHPGIMGWDMLSAIVRGLHERTKITVEMHSCEGSSALVAAVPGLQFANRVMVHNGPDYMLAAKLLGTDSASLIPHGISAPISNRSRNSGEPDGIRLVSFGMAGPHKGFHRVIEVLALLRELDLNASYHILTSFSSRNSRSRQYLKYCMERAHQLNVQDQVRIDFRFLSTEELLSKLSSCDIGVMAYDDDVTEGASGATRVMLRANLPLVLSRAPIFDEFRDVALTVGGKGLSLAREIYQLALSPERQRKILERQATFAALTDWNNVARMVFGYFDAY